MKNPLVITLVIFYVIWKCLDPNNQQIRLSDNYGFYVPTSNIGSTYIMNVEPIFDFVIYRSIPK